MTGHSPTGRPERPKAENWRWLESATNIALFLVMIALIWLGLTVFWPALFGSFSSVYEFAVFLLLVCTALLLACAGGLHQGEAKPPAPSPAVARETVVSVSLPEMSVVWADPPVAAGQPAPPHATSPASEPVLTLPEG